MAAASRNAIHRGKRGGSMGRNEFESMNSGKATAQTALFQVDFRLDFASFNALLLLYTPAEKSQKNNRK
ncbi:MAG: hypothetical protein IT426_04275 [Pirellulales bacterium]|nr:hypothetical protein [Pirellulales bacterium]